MLCVVCTQRFLLFSYLDFRVYFACYPPESFKIIWFTCIWLKFVDKSFHSSQNPQQNPCRISQFSKNRGVKLITHRGLGLAKSLCAPNLEAVGSNAKFCEFFSLEVRKLLCLQDRETIYESCCLRRAKLNMICKLNHRKLYHVQMDVTKYLALLDQFLTNDIIDSCTLTKTINVMIDSEMSQNPKNWCDLLHYWHY